MSRDPYARSTKSLELARKFEALIDAKPSLFWTGHQRIGGSPIFAQNAKGKWVYDVDGNKFIDYVLGYGSVILGHAHKVVDDAAIRCIRKGVNPTMLSEENITLAEKLSTLVPNIEKSTFFKTGSDATTAAIRTARSYTNKKLILSYGLHGWHDWCQQSPSHGIDHAGEWTRLFRYNDFDEVSKIFELHGDKIAGVIMMPYEIEMPAPGFLEHLRYLCEKNGALLIFDEIRSSFRISTGGAQSFFGINADLVCLGKAMGNGYPISALGGRADIMRHISSVGHTVTYTRSPFSMSASIATIDEIVRRNVPQQISKTGTYLIKKFNDLAEEINFPIKMEGHCTTPNIRFLFKPHKYNQGAKMQFSNAMLSHGIIVHPKHHLFICAEHTNADIDYFISATKDALISCKWP